MLNLSSHVRQTKCHPTASFVKIILSKLSSCPYIDPPIPTTLETLPPREGYYHHPLENPRTEGQKGKNTIVNTITYIYIYIYIAKGRKTTLNHALKLSILSGTKWDRMGQYELLQNFH
jgi:hypothetical protein